MKKIILSALALVVSLAGANAQLKADVKKSDITWVGKKVTGEHTGKISLKSGTVDLAGNKLKGGTFVFDMTSITCTDLEGEWNDKLIGHLKSDDFFAVDKYPTSTFKITKVTGKEITGDLTIKGITNSITFPADVKIEGSKLTAKADVKVDRTKYDIKYGSASFFDGLADKAIDNEFILKFNIVASK